MASRDLWAAGEIFKPVEDLTYAVWSSDPLNVSWLNARFMAGWNQHKPCRKLCRATRGPQQLAGLYYKHGVKRFYVRGCWPRCLLALPVRHNDRCRHIEMDRSLKLCYKTATCLRSNNFFWKSRRRSKGKKLNLPDVKNIAQVSYKQFLAPRAWGLGTIAKKHFFVKIITEIALTLLRPFRNSIQ